MHSSLPLVGFGLPVSGSWASPPTMARIARRAEDAGYEALWSFQRILVPASGSQEELGSAQNPGTRPIEDPAYRSVHDALLPLAYVAAHTSRIRLGTATICALFTPPVLLAKALATADHLSGGRLQVGLGMGWLPQEYAAAGIPHQRRGARMDEYLHVLQRLWAEDEVEHHGEFYDLPLARLGVLPVQRPRPPLLLGGVAPAALRRAGRLADGWIASSRQDPEEVGASIAVVHEGAREVGRDPHAVRVVMRALVDLRERPLDRRAPLQGSAEQIREDVVALRGRGVTEVFFDLNFSRRVGSPDVDRSAAEEYAEQVLDALSPRALA